MEGRSVNELKVIAPRPTGPRVEKVGLSRTSSPLSMLTPRTDRVQFEDKRFVPINTSQTPSGDDKLDRLSTHSQLCKLPTSNGRAGDADSFQKRLFGLQPPSPNKVINMGPQFKRTSDVRCSTRAPPLSPATISDKPWPPPEPNELRYMECSEVKMGRVVNYLLHVNVCVETTCTELCVYIKWFANHRKTCRVIFTSEKRCDYCQQFMQWQYQHCINCRCCPNKGCAADISWCPPIKQSILKTKLESYIGPVVKKLQNGYSTGHKQNSRLDNCSSSTVEYHATLKEHLWFGCGSGRFVEGEHWRKNRQVGRGRAGSCWEAKLLECPFFFAVKEAKMDNPLRVKRNLDEIYCGIKMKYLNQHVCPHIIDYYGFTAKPLSAPNMPSFMGPPSPMLLQIHMELMSCNLHSYVSDRDRNGPLLFDKVVDFSYQLFSALEFLHTNLRILHRDIKPGNILVAHSEQRIKLTDFDCAALLDEWKLSDNFVQGDHDTGTVHYNPPELYRDAQFSWSLDIWQAACCVLFMCTGHRPWRHAYFDCDSDHPNRNAALYVMRNKISTHQKHLLPSFLPPTLHSLLSKCLHDDWKARLTSLDVLYLLDPDAKSRSKLLSNLDITDISHETGPRIVYTKQDSGSHVVVDIYLADYCEREGLRGIYLQPGWLASIDLPVNISITYGQIRTLIYNSTEIEVMRHLAPCEFYIYKNDRVRIRELLIKELTLKEFNVMDDNDIVDPNNAIILRVIS